MEEQENRTFKRAIIVSVILHIILLTIFFFGLPSVFERMPEEQNFVIFETVSISEIANIKTESPVKKTVEPEKSKEVKSSSSAKKEEPTQEEVKPEEKIEPKKEAEKTPEETEKIPEKEKVKKEPEKKQPEKKEKPKKEKPKVKPKPKAVPKDVDPMDSILKNLEDESEGDDSKTLAKNNSEQAEGTKRSKGMEYDEDSPLSITEKLLVRRQVEAVWHKDIVPEGVGAILHMVLEKDGTVKEVTVKNIICPANVDAAICKLVEENAIRAVKQASPIKNLTVDRYDTWKEFDMKFDPNAD